VIQVYIVPDTPGSVESLIKTMEKSSGQLLTKPNHLGLQYNNSDLQCGVISTGQGWFVRPIKSDIKARDLLLCYDRDSPANFTLELEQIVSNVTNVGLELVVSQTGTNVSQDNKHSMIKLSLNTNQSSSARSSSGCSSLSLSPPCPPPSGQLRLSPAVSLLCTGQWRLDQTCSWSETVQTPDQLDGNPGQSNGLHMNDLNGS